MPSLKQLIQAGFTTRQGKALLGLGGGVPEFSPVITTSWNSPYMGGRDSAGFLFPDAEDLSVAVDGLNLVPSYLHGVHQADTPDFLTPYCGVERFVWTDQTWDGFWGNEPKPASGLIINPGVYDLALVAFPDWGNMTGEVTDDTEVVFDYWLTAPPGQSQQRKAAVNDLRARMNAGSLKGYYQSASFASTRLTIFDRSMLFGEVDYAKGGWINGRFNTALSIQKVG